MTFISYAQNYEDVMLNRIFKDIDNGFYIDVGAWSPVIDSVTQAFYQKGWSGINIEPNKKFMLELSLARQRDVNLSVCIGRQEELVEMYFLRGDGSGMSTLDLDIAQERLNEGWEYDKEIVEMQTLKKVWSSHVPKDQEVHFLKIDVEGHEQSVLLSINWSEIRNRPWVILVESTMPMSQIEVHENWESILIQAGYIFAYADGLNRFYVDGVKDHLLNFFKYPPNVFDDFISSALFEAQENLMKIRTLQTLSQDKIRALESEIENKNKVISLILNSTSWKITRPLRLIADNLNKIIKHK